MIRIIVAKLLEVGKGNLSMDEFEYLLTNKIALNNARSAFPQGLYLTKVYLSLFKPSTTK